MREWSSIFRGWSKRRIWLRRQHPLDGQRVWKRVLAAVKEIQREEPEEGEAVN